MNNAFLKFSKKFSLTFTITAIIVSVSMIGILAYSQMYKQRQTLSNVGNSYISLQVAAAMSLWLDGQIQLAQVLANAPEIIDYSKSPLNMDKRAIAQKFLERNYSILPYLSLINVMYYLQEGEDQLELTVDGKTYDIKNGFSIVDSIQGKSIGIGGFSFSYIKAVGKGSSAYISEVKPNSIDGLPPIYMVAVPIYDSDKKLIAALGFGIKLDYFNRQFITNFNKNFNLGNTGRIEIIDNRGKFIGASDSAKLLADWTEVEGNAVLSNLDPDNGTIFSLNFLGVNYDYSASPVLVDHDMATDWWVMYIRSRSVIHQGLSTSRNWLFFVCSIAALFMVIMTVRSSRAIIREKRELVKRRTYELKKMYFDAAPYALILADKNWHIVDVNQVAISLFSYSEEELLQQKLDELILSELGLFSVVMLNHPSGECTGKNKNGNLLKFAYDLCEIEGGQYLIFFRDETELETHRTITTELSENLAKTLEESERLRMEAEQANSAKSEFLANMSHEIRTPMNAIIGISHLLLQQNLNNSQQRYAEKIQNAGKYLLGVINSVLDFSKIEAGKMTIESTPFMLANVLEDVLSIFQQSFIDKGVHFEIYCAPKVPPNLVGDPLRLGQIISNLVGNALKFTEKGEVILSVSLLNQIDDQILLQFQVKDSGIGMSKEESKKLFKAFTQADTSTTRKYGGTGLGLVISKLLAELMGGELTFKSLPAEGTTFSCTVLFSLWSSEDKAILLPSYERNLKSIEGKHVLLVEDNIINQFVAIELLNGVKIIVSKADNGKIAVDMLSNPNHNFDLVLMDIQMPIMDGHEATCRIREFPHNATLPIIAMTAHAMTSERDRCLASGMNDHLGKPIEVDKMYATLEYWFNRMTP